MVKSKSIRLIIDSNLWIGFIISNNLNKLDSYIYSNNTRIIFSAALVRELRRTGTKPKLQKYFERYSIDLILQKFDKYIDFHEVISKVNVCRDPNDDFLLALAKDAKADFLITGDKDLLTLKVFEKTKIVTFQAFDQLTAN
ncbi:hypothetical protein SAMN04488029_2224 [Reichenbachiella faecimaris]|uniref:PIN domain-containing protein n=1 Tax=Reichenbachiella faecimaris TaxID=692418 RepID=A0A1W2GEF4_REIFA|nr:hypothetical protein SAMN04488029_2224 [Reichenbachiella faecimaris]